MTTVKELIAALQKFGSNDSVEIHLNKLRVTTEIFRGITEQKDIQI